MSLHNYWLPIVTITGSSLMVGCGGDRGGSCGIGSDGCVGPIVITGDGYYEGTVSAPGGGAGTSVVAIIADNGDGAIAGQDGTYYRLNVSLPNNDVNGTYLALSDGPTFPNGTLISTGSISAVASPDLSGTLLDQTGSSQSLAATFDSVYNLGSALSTLAGSWSFTANGVTLTMTIQADGTFSGTDSNSCTYTGAFLIIDPSFNAYSENHVRTCGGVTDMFTGLATYFPPVGASASADIKLLADDNASEFLVADLQ